MPNEKSQTQKSEMIINVISIVFAIMLLYCWKSDLPYLYFQFIRVTGMIVFGLLAYQSYTMQKMNLAIVFFLSVLIINPFFKVPLGRFNWNVLDTVWAVLLLINAKHLLSVTKSSENPN
jgi:hypothetical protein